MQKPYIDDPQSVLSWLDLMFATKTIVHKVKVDWEVRKIGVRRKAGRRKSWSQRPWIDSVRRLEAIVFRRNGPLRTLPLPLLWFLRNSVKIFPKTDKEAGKKNHIHTWVTKISNAPREIFFLSTSILIASQHLLPSWTCLWEALEEQN